MRVCVIDSGYNPTESIGEGISIIQYDCFMENEKLQIFLRDYPEDRIGHGTAVISTLLTTIEQCTVLVFRIFFDTIEVDQQCLLLLLEHIYSNVDCHILHMSIGISLCENIHAFSSICQKIHEKGTVLVAAYSNEGNMSYPACFDSVIGVDSFGIPPSKKYILVKDSLINYQVNIGYKRVKVGESIQLFHGSSFSAAFITNQIIKHTNGNSCLEALSALDMHAVNTIHDKNWLAPDANVSGVSQRLCKPSN